MNSNSLIGGMPLHPRKARYRGVSWDKANRRWTARVWKDSRSHFAGNHRTESEAAEAYNKKAIELFGEDAILNEVDSK